MHEYLAAEFGSSIAEAREMTDHVKALAAQEGLAFDASRAWMVNTFDAHRVAHLAKKYGLLGQMQERLMRAHHIEGQILDDPQTLERLAGEVGVPGDEVRRVLAGDEYAAQVHEDIRAAAKLGVTGVPFFVLNGAYSVSGAQPVTTFLSAELGRAELKGKSMRRRRVMAAPFVLAAAAAPSRDWLLSTLDETTSENGPPKIDMRQVDGIREMFRIMQEMDVMRGGGHARVALVE